MNLSDLFARLEVEFDVDIPEAAEETLLTIRDIRDYIRDCYRDQGIDQPAIAVFVRVCRVVAAWAKVDSRKLQPESKLADLMPKSDMLIWG